MTLITNAFGPASTLGKLLDEVFEKDGFFNGNGFRTLNGTLPAVNILETDTGFVLEMAAPGLSKKDFQIELDNGVLTISANREVQPQEGQTFVRREFGYGSFSRSFSLPEVVDLNGIRAEYVDGILKVHLPKVKEAIPQTRQIEVG